MAVWSGLRAQGHERAQSSGAEGAAIMGLYPSSFFSFFLFIFLLSAGTKGSGGELRHLAGSPGGGGGY